MLLEDGLLSYLVTVANSSLTVKVSKDLLMQNEVLV
jgi:hypothetical protein